MPAIPLIWLDNKNSFFIGLSFSSKKIKIVLDTQQLTQVHKNWGSKNNKWITLVCLEKS